MVEHGIDFFAPILAINELRPAHFTRDNLVALRMVEILLEQLHVLLRLLILLLEKTFPVVLVPSSFGAIVAGHAVFFKSASQTAQRGFLSGRRALRAGRRQAKGLLFSGLIWQPREESFQLRGGRHENES